MDLPEGNVLNPRFSGQKRNVYDTDQRKPTVIKDSRETKIKISLMVDDKYDSGRASRRK